MTTPVREVERSGRGGMAGRRGESASGPRPHAAEDGPVMPTDAPLAPAVRSETAAPYAACNGAPPPSAETLLARIERAGPAALDDHELLGLVGIDIDAATLAAAGGLREFLDDPDDMLRVVLLAPENRARVHALHEVHTRWMEARLRRDGGPLTSPANTRRYIEARLRGYRNEVFACLFLDNRHRIIAFEELFRGTASARPGAPRASPGAGFAVLRTTACGCVRTARHSIAVAAPLRRVPRRRFPHRSYRIFGRPDRPGRPWVPHPTHLWCMARRAAHAASLTVKCLISRNPARPWRAGKSASHLRRSYQTTI